MFGLRIVTKKQLLKIESAARAEAIADLVTILKNKDRIFLAPVTLVGDNQAITDCAFLGTGDQLLTVAQSSIAYRETLNYSAYCKYPLRQSISGQQVPDRENGVLTCPHCGAQHRSIEHGTSILCKCGLLMQRYGNALQITDRRYYAQS